MQPVRPGAALNCPTCWVSSWMWVTYTPPQPITAMARSTSPAMYPPSRRLVELKLSSIKSRSSPCSRRRMALIRAHSLSSRPLP